MKNQSEADPPARLVQRRALQHQPPFSHQPVALVKALPPAFLAFAKNSDQRQTAVKIFSRQKNALEESHDHQGDVV